MVNHYLILLILPVSIYIDIFFISTRLRLIRVVHRPKYKEPFRMDYWERGSHVGGVYPTQDTSRMVTARMKQEKEADTRTMAREK